MRDRLEVANALQRMIDRGSTGVLATLVAVEGSFYRQPGARTLMEVQATGPRENPLQIVAGIISGGCLEQDLVRAALPVLEDQIPTLFYADLTSPEEPLLGYGTGCPGKVKILLEPVGASTQDQEWSPAMLTAFQSPAAVKTIGIVYESTRPEFPLGTRVSLPLKKSIKVSEAKSPDDPKHHDHRDGFVSDQIKIFWEKPVHPPTIYLFGAGADGKATAEMLLAQGFPVRVFDHRPFAADERRFREGLSFQGPHSLRVNLWTETDPAGLGGWGVDRESFVILMTHHFLKDLEILAKITLVQPRYIGILGSRKRAAALREACDSKDLVVPWDTVHAPIGKTPYTCDDPWQIGLAITAEILKELLA